MMSTAPSAFRIMGVPHRNSKRGADDSPRGGGGGIEYADDKGVANATFTGGDGQPDSRGLLYKTNYNALIGADNVVSLPGTLRGWRDAA